jgi:hypothetical protein
VNMMRSVHSGHIVNESDDGDRRGDNVGDGGYIVCVCVCVYHFSL